MERHKSRLKGEFIKARVRRGCASIDDLKTAVQREKKAAVGGNATTAVYPRWIRVNTVRTTLQTQLEGTFSSYKRVDSLSGLVQDDEDQERLFIDPDIPDLVAVPPGVEFTSSPAYKNGEIILQDKASCIPAYLLAGDGHSTGNLVDACAAPGNKTTHLAALLAKQGTSKKSRILSMDASPTRSKTLQKMVAAAGAGDVVTVLPGQDFLALDPVTDPRFNNVTGLLLDPSCSGSGIIGRDDVPELLLPSIPQNQNRNGKKRKREPATQTTESSKTTTTTATTATDENDTITTSPDRLVKLSNLQTRIVEHALSFPSAERVTYSTCSVHVLENETVVQRVLASDVARRRGWGVLHREEQPEGLRGWRARGVRSDNSEDGNATPATGMEVNLGEEDLQGCLRCWPGDEEGVGGFFVVGFVRDADSGQNSDEGEEDEDEWGGFSD